MLTEHDRLLREALRAQPPDDEAGESDLAIEKMGNAAFDWILREVRSGSLKPGEVVRGLRLLSRLTRQFCIQRKGELLDLMLGLAANADADRAVRSAAAHIAVTNVGIARGLSHPGSAFERSAACPTSTTFTLPRPYRPRTCTTART